MPIILITGHRDIPMNVRAMKAGAVEFLTKPFRDQDLLDAVRSALEKVRERRERSREVSDLKQRDVVWESTLCKTGWLGLRCHKLILNTSVQ